MLAGYIATAIGSGLVSLLISALAGHPVIVSLMFYCLSGGLGLIALAIRNLELASNLDRD